MLPAIQPIQPLDEETFLRMLRFGLRSGANRLYLRPGFRPLIDGLGGPRELGFRQLTAQDTVAAASALLGRLWTPEPMEEGAGDAAQALDSIAFVDAGGDEALVEAHFETCRGGIALALDLVRPLPAGEAPRLLEG